MRIYGFDGYAERKRGGWWLVRSCEELTCNCARALHLFMQITYSHSKRWRRSIHQRLVYQCMCVWRIMTVCFLMGRMFFCFCLILRLWGNHNHCDSLFFFLLLFSFFFSFFNHTQHTCTPTHTLSPSYISIGLISFFLPAALEEEKKKRKELSKQDSPQPYLLKGSQWNK